MKDLLEKKENAELAPQLRSPLPRTTQTSRRSIHALACLIIIVVAAAYWPVIHGNFVWDDWQSFRDKPWLTQGDLWKHYILRDFNWWVYYFRPLVLAFLTLQVRLFDSTPGPMHAVSLALHLVDVMLVGKLSWQIMGIAQKAPNVRVWATALCMALYGLHPALVESVAWIGCQFDLITTMLTLLGLIANLGIQRQTLRAIVLAALFFMAACSKESAMSFPLLVGIFDWLLVNAEQKSSPTQALRALIRRNGIAYAGMLAAGCIYLVFRHWALGSITNGLEGYPIPLFARLQVIGFIYFHYWKIMLWPIADMSPLHPSDIQTFTVLTSTSLAMTVASLGVVIIAFYASIRHASPAGCIIVAFTVGLLPVLQVIPGHFERSLYHARYATTALAVTMAMLPLICWPVSVLPQVSRRYLFLSAIGALFLWLSFSIVDIRTVLPLWSNDIVLWRWALSVNPASSEAKEYLLLSYVRSRNFSAATAYADTLLADPSSCITCVISVAELALSNDDLPRARLAISELKRLPLLDNDKRKLLTYYQLKSQLLLKENDLEGADRSARAAVATDPKDQASRNLLQKIDTLRKAPESGAHP